MGMFFSCSENQISIEKPSLKHGVFTYALLAAVRDLNERGRAVTWDHLVAEVKDRVPELNPDQFPVSSANVPRIELGRVKRRGFPETIGVKMVTIPSGSFWMGTTDEQLEQILKLFPGTKREQFADEQPAHRVEITRKFELSAHEITVGQFRKFVDDTGYRTEAEKDGKGGYGFDQAKGEFRQDPKYTWRDPDFPQGKEHPVVNVSYNDALAFCSWLSRKDGRTYRLPTEAEWEYACRAGRETLYSNGDDPEGLAQIGNVADARAKAKFADWPTIAADDGHVFTAPVGQYQPNGFGLFDMTGNVWEWCLDYYHEAYYKESPPSDPRGPGEATLRVSRGGGWDYSGRNCRSAYRDRCTPVYRSSNLGFRVARVSSR
jgi:formylglycine-generating enzyme required for sulfatase activity